MRNFRYLLYVFSLLYGSVLALRNLFFNWGIFKIKKVNATVVSVGNLSVGGTGKTPHVEWLATALKGKYKVAILLRGYGRITQGYQKVTAESTVEQVGDEALTYFFRFAGAVFVSVCENRVEGAQKLLNDHPEIDLILLDDAFQHRFIYRDVNILLTEYARPFYKDFALPCGRLREFRSGKNRADMVVVTKSPLELETSEKEMIKKKLKMQSNVPVHFSSIIYGDFKDVKSNATKTVAKNILLVTGIGNPTPLQEQLEKQANVKLIQFSDHHQYTLQDIIKIHKLFDTFASADKCIVTTEKDKARLHNEAIQKEISDFPWLYQSITVKIEKKQEILNTIAQYADENKRNG